MTGSASPVFTDVDYERDGKQIGQLYLPHSVTRSAYGNIAIPVCVVKNGSGPTMALSAGNHGDEYEGQIALNKFIEPRIHFSYLGFDWIKPWPDDGMYVHFLIVSTAVVSLRFVSFS